jgi:hypothetical protein
MDYRIAKLREYLFTVINKMTTNRNYQISADMLGKIGDFSLDKIPTNTEVENWIIGIQKKRDVYSFRSRKAYSQDTINNLKNIGFFEEFENTIKSNNDEGILPEIENIESIECLNCGTLNSVDGTQATFDIQIQITYIEKEKGGTVSL